MLPLLTGRDTSSGVRALVYARHHPERTLLYQLVQEYFPAFKAHLAAQGAELPGYVDGVYVERPDGHRVHPTGPDPGAAHRTVGCTPSLARSLRAHLVRPNSLQANLS